MYQTVQARSPTTSGNTVALGQTGEPTFCHTKVHSNYTELLAVKNWSFLSPLTWEFWQGCPEQISIVFLCQILTGQAALCFNFFSSTGNCRRKEKTNKKPKHILSNLFSAHLPLLLLKEPFFLLKIKEGMWTKEMLLHSKYIQTRRYSWNWTVYGLICGRMFYMCNQNENLHLNISFTSLVIFQPRAYDSEQN